MIYALFAYKPNAKPLQIIIFCPELNLRKDFCLIYAQPQGIVQNVFHSILYKRPKHKRLEIS